MRLLDFRKMFIQQVILKQRPPGTLSCLKRGADLGRSRLVFSPVAQNRPLLRKTDGAKIIHTVKTFWIRQHAVFELLT